MTLQELEQNTWTANQEVRAKREHLGALIDELERRRHELLNVRLQMRRHPAPFIATASLLVAGIAGTVIYFMRKRRLEAKARHVISKAGKLRHALGRAIERPESVAPKERRFPARLGAAAATSAASVLGQALAKRLVRALAETRGDSQRTDGRSSVSIPRMPPARSTLTP